jgi:hypothetical protein
MTGSTSRGSNGPGGRVGGRDPPEARVGQGPSPSAPGWAERCRRARLLECLLARCATRTTRRTRWSARAADASFAGRPTCLVSPRRSRAWKGPFTRPWTHPSRRSPSWSRPRFPLVPCACPKSGSRSTGRPTSRMAPRPTGRRDRWSWTAAATRMPILAPRLRPPAPVPGAAPPPPRPCAIPAGVTARATSSRPFLRRRGSRRRRQRCSARLASRASPTGLAVQSAACRSRRAASDLGGGE